MFEGKLGEKAIKQLFIDNNILFKEDDTSHEEADFFDFIVWYQKNNVKLKVDVKTRTKNFHIRTVEMVEQINKNPKEIYISVRLFIDKKTYKVEVIGFALKNDFLAKNDIQNLGYLDNYILYDRDLRPIDDFLQKLTKNEI